MPENSEFIAQRVERICQVCKCKFLTFNFDKYCDPCKPIGKKIQAKRYRETHKEFIAQKRKEWNLAHREQKSKSGKEWRQTIRTKCLDHYGSKCVCCGEAKLEFLQLHHINHDGKNHREANNNTFIWLVKNNFPDEYKIEVVCANCHFARHFYGKCPHGEKNE